jgi:hypothetical protein
MTEVAMSLSLYALTCGHLEASSPISRVQISKEPSSGMRTWKEPISHVRISKGLTFGPRWGLRTVNSTRGTGAAL